MNIAVGYPWSSPFVYAAFVDSLLTIETPEGCNMKIIRGKGYCPARRHNDICEKALDWGADLICIIGADQIYESDIICRLYKRFCEGYEIVSALVPARGFIPKQRMRPYQPCAWRFKHSTDTRIRQYRSLDLDGDMLEIIDPKDGDIQMINFIGSGVLMFHRDHLLALKKPWFGEKINVEDNFKRTACMDTIFVWRLQTEAHATVWVDTTIKVKHLHIFEIDDTFQYRFEDTKELFRAGC